MNQTPERPESLSDIPIAHVHGIYRPHILTTTTLVPCTPCTPGRPESLSDIPIAHVHGIYRPHILTTTTLVPSSISVIKYVDKMTLI